MNVYGPLLAPSVAERIRAQVSALEVRGLADLARLAEDSQPDRVAYVLPSRESAGARSTGSAVFRQPVRAEVAVILGARNYSDATGAAAVDELTALVLDVRRALLAWTPPGARTVLEFAGGSIVPAESADLVFWQDRFVCDYWLEVTP